QKQRNLDLSPLLNSHPAAEGKPQTCQVERNQPFDKGLLAEKMIDDMIVPIRQGQGGTFSYQVGNCDRSIGARISGEIAQVWGNLGMSDSPIKLHLAGTAGQSLGVWNAGGLHIDRKSVV